MSQAPEARPRRMVKSSYDLGGGLFLLALAALGFMGGFNLAMGTLSCIGSGMVPKAVSIMVGAFGVLLMVQSLLIEGDRLERWHLRGPVFVLGGVLAFAMLIRGSTLSLGLGSITIPPLGLIVAGPVAVIVASFASPETRLKEIAVHSVVLTLASGLVFKELLNLPIPYDPAGLVPGPIYDAYLAIRTAIGHALAFIASLLAR